ncbi:hypothetical protein ACIGKR_12335 [Rhodococcus qingshengii]|uniref:hypothetical protein n=1 Tax=Rhodococcus qingshengii TaxID=334542 RepID=UPI0037C68C26
MASVLGIVRRMPKEDPTEEREQLRAKLIESRHRNGFDVHWELHKEHELRDRIGNFGTSLVHLVPA